jgi:hypothetical protein
MLILMSFIFTANCSVKAAPKDSAAGSTTTAGNTTVLPLTTGQTQCWNAAGTLDATCTLATSLGQDGQLKLGRAANFTGPTQNATYNTDYTTKDNVTGLIWKTCSEGLSGATCATGAATTYTWANATPACTALNTANAGAGYAGRTTWRLPTDVELKTLINYSGVAPFTFTTVFPATVANFYWSSSTYVPGTANAWYVSFVDGSVLNVVKTGSTCVRCVSTGP